MQQEKIEFVVVNDPVLDFDLIREAWVNNELLADVRFTNNQWMIRFFGEDKYENKYSEVSWETTQRINAAFADFIREQTYSLQRIQDDTASTKGAELQ